MGYKLGVDLGTTWTAAAVDEGDGPRALALDDQRPALASTIARVGDEFVFGAAAEHQVHRALGGVSGMTRAVRRVRHRRWPARWGGRSRSAVKVRPESMMMLAATVRAVAAVSPIPAQPARSIRLPPMAVPALPPMKYTTM